MTQHPDHPVNITSARPSHSDDLRKRKIRYLISMGVRTSCFVLAIITSGPLRWTFVAGAVFLPYVAVVLANATDRRTASGPASFLTPDRPALKPRPGPGDHGPPEA